MADKRISQLIERTDIANNDVLPIVASGATTTNKVTISTIQNWMQDNLDVGVTSVGITLGSSGTDVNVTGSPITTSGNITINIPTASATNRGLLSSTDWSTFNNKVPYTGAVADVDLGQRGIEARYFSLETSPATLPGNQGAIYWDTARSTAALIMNGTTQHIGQDSFFYVKNSTGYTIAKGTCVGFAGTDGASGHLLIQPFLANGSQPSTYFMGVTAEDITNGSFGQVMQFGELSGINTSGYTAGALLYASTSVAGAFQTTAPQAPNNIILVAAAVNSTNNGSIIVRPQIGSNINTDEGVKITSVADKDLLQYQSGTGLWENKTRDAAGVVTTDTTQTITGLKTFSGPSLRLAANGTADAVVLRNVSGTTGSDTGATTIGFNGNDNIFVNTQSRGGFILGFNNSVSNREYTLPDASGTIALTSNLGSYLPLTGGTLTGALNGTSATMSGLVTGGTGLRATGGTDAGSQLSLFANGSGNTFIAGFDINFNTGSNGARTTCLTLASTGAATFSSSVTASNFVSSYSSNGFNLDLSKSAGFGALIQLKNTSASSNELVRVLDSSNNIISQIYPASNGIAITTGNVGIGTASPVDVTNYTSLHIAGKNTSLGGILRSTTSDNSVIGLFLANIDGGLLSMDTNHALRFATNSTERMRITSGGDVLIGQTSVPGAFGDAVGLTLRPTGAVLAVADNNIAGLFARRNVNGDVIFFRRDTTTVGSISVTTTATSYNTSSDYRLKENVKPVENALSILTQLKPCTFNFIAESEEEVMGFLAHEVQEVMPQAVKGEKDAVKIEQVEVSPAELDEEGNVITEAVIEEKEVPVYQGIDHSKLVPLLVASIQELKAEIEALKSQING